MKVFFAYIDPSTGSMFLQVIIGFLLAATVVLRTYIVAILRKIKNLVRKNENNDE